MIVDMHIHIADYSPCSNIELEEAIIKAKKIGLDGLCITDHESNYIEGKAKELSKKHDFLIIVGMELLSYEGDVLVFGLGKVPKNKMHANDLVKIVSEKGRITISAHPFRDNGRGMGEHIKKVSRLSGIEAFNGNTEFHQNLQAYYLSKELKLPCFGGSDAHKVEQIGKYATFFEDEIKGVNDLIKAVKERRVYPVKYNSEKNIFGEIIL